jgi:sulfate adenylyltransferase (ADP) / ATP adenylyltransferase
MIDRSAPGTLWEALQTATRNSLRSGALQPIVTDLTAIEQDGIRFQVRILGNVARKDRTAQQRGKDFNPFLPYDPQMFVAHLSATHVALLNKFNVIDHHLLIVPCRFEAQESLLTLEDFRALWSCMREIDGLAFYNAGPEAGASQRHKHLQLVPLPLVPEEPSLPIDPLLQAAPLADGIGAISAFPFAHAFTHLEASTTPDDLLHHYARLRDHLGLQPQSPYNLLATRRWLLLVSRSREHFATPIGNLSINAMGFAGALLVRNGEQLEQAVERGLVEVLRTVAVPR